MDTHTTNAAQSEDTTRRNTTVTLNKAYILTLPAILLKVAIIASIIVLICASVGLYLGGNGFVIFVTIIAIITGVVLYICHLLNIRQNIALPWNIVLFTYCVIFAILYLISGIILAAYAGQFYFFRSSNGVGAFFSFATVILYGVMAFLYYNESGNSPQLAGRPRESTNVKSYDNSYAVNENSIQIEVPTNPRTTYDPTSYGGGAPDSTTY